MRGIVFLFAFLHFLTFGQIEVMDSTKLQQLDTEWLTYVNVSAEKKLHIEELSNVLVDFSTLERLPGRGWQCLVGHYW